MSGTWIWTTSNRTIEGLFENWRENDPSGDGNCIELRRRSNGLWNDKNCDDPRWYICEFAYNDD